MLHRVLLGCVLVVGGCSAAPSETRRDAPEYLGQSRVAHGAPFDGTVIGGLSAISYDPDNDLYYIVSDDRSQKSPARFYTARIRLSANRIDGIDFTATHPFTDRDGEPFPPPDAAARPPVLPPDPEGIAYDTERRVLYWSHEGTRLTDGLDAPALLDPRVRIATLDGRYVGEFALPPMLRTSADQTGPRNNLGIEGLTLAPDGRHLWAAMEGPGLNDGEVPTEGAGALTRITRFDVETRQATAQYAYPLDSVTTGPDGANGLTALLALDDANFLAVERSHGTHMAVRLYRAGLGDAEDVMGRPSLTGPTVRTMTKTMLADLTSTVDPLGNVEGITFGPTLPDGRRALILVSDDNFSPKQPTQVLAFAYWRSA